MKVQSHLVFVTPMALASAVYALLCEKTRLLSFCLLGACAVSGAEPLDGSFVFSLDTRAGDANGNGTVDAAEIGDRLRFSSAVKPTVSILDGYAVKTLGLPSVSWKTLPTCTPAFQTLNDPVRNEACLWFPQHFTYEDGVSTNMSPSAVDIDAPAGGGVAGESTMFLRFYWAGMPKPFEAMNTRSSTVLYKWDWTAATGWAFCLHPLANTGKFYMSFGPGKKNTVLNFGGAVFESNTWYDVVATLAPTAADANKTQVKMWIARPRVKNNVRDGYPEIVYRTEVADQRLAYDDNVNRKVRLGAEYVGNAKAWDDASNQNNGCCKSFRGGIRDLKIWDRALTEVEVYSVFAGYYGKKWAVGAANGSADEFAAEEDAPVAVYDPQSQPWSSMRRALTAAQPTLTLKSALTTMETDASYPRILAITPIFGADMADASACVDVAVNGVAAGTFDLRKAEGRHIFLPGKYWTADADGNVTVTITRVAPVTGTLSIDALELGSSWQVGKADNRVDDMLNESWHKEVYYGGDTNAFHFRRAALGGMTGNVASNTYFHVSVPADVARRHAFTFSTRVISQGGADQTVKDLCAQGKLPFAVVLNGREISVSSGVTNGTFITIPLEAGSLQAGLNRFEVQNRACNANGFTNWCWMNFDYMRLEVGKRVKGLAIVVR